MSDYPKINIGDIVLFDCNGATKEGEILSIYAVPEEIDLVDIQTPSETLRGVPTSDIIAIKEEETTWNN